VRTNRTTRAIIAAGVLAGATLAGTGRADAAGVSYTDPPPPLPLNGFARVTPPGGMTGPPEVAAAESGATVVFSNDTTSVAHYAGYDGVVSAPVPLAARIFAVTPGPAGVVYGISSVDTPPLPNLTMVAIAMGGPRLGQVVASTPIEGDVAYVEIPNVVFANTSRGIVDSARDHGAVVSGHVDQNGSPLDDSHLPGQPLVQTPTVIIDLDRPDAWDISIERDPGYRVPYVGEEPPARTAEGVSVWATTIGPSTGGDVGDPTVPVIAVLRPGRRAEWYSVTDGWAYASSDVWGTVFQRRAADGSIELARIDPGFLRGDDDVCPTYHDHVEHRYPFRLCDSGGFVTALQGLLRYDHGYDVSVDGYYGPGTEEAVRRFQAANGLAVDGLTGPLTWAALIAPYAGDPMRTDTDGSGLVDPWEFGDPHSAATEGAPTG
jgi:peptidoglycan hydrolase-like protein with peptidoglycan-binding domain